jgi:hypothetical protein
MYEAVSIFLPGFSAPPLRETLTVKPLHPKPSLLETPYTPHPNFLKPLHHNS